MGKLHGKAVRRLQFAGRQPSNVSSSVSQTLRCPDIKKQVLSIRDGRRPRRRLPPPPPAAAPTAGWRPGLQPLSAPLALPCPLAPARPASAAPAAAAAATHPASGRGSRRCRRPRRLPLTPLSAAAPAAGRCPRCWPPPPPLVVCPATCCRARRWRRPRRPSLAATTPVRVRPAGGRAVGGGWRVAGFGLSGPRTSGVGGAASGVGWLREL